MAKSRKTKASPAPKKKKSALPDVIGSCHVIVKAAEGDKYLLLEGGQTWGRGADVRPYVFPTRMHAEAYLDGMAPHMKENLALGVEKFSVYYEQDWLLAFGSNGELNVSTSPVPKGTGTSLRRAVKNLEEAAFPLAEVRAGIRSIEAEHKKQRASIEAECKRQHKAATDHLKQLEKGLKAFQASVRKLGDA